MPHFPRRSMVLCCFPVLIFLGGCNAKVECDTPETRNEVLKIVADDRSNALANYAARNSDVKNSDVAKENSSAGSSAAKPAKPGSAKPSYSLGEKIVTTSVSEDKRTLTCSSGISVTIGDVKATKTIDFTVQHSPDGKLSVSVTPFQF